MTPENQQIIRNIMGNQNPIITFIENNKYFRITGNFGLADHVYFKIPKIATFKLQLYFEGINNLGIRDFYLNQFLDLGYQCTPNNANENTNYCFIYLGQQNGLQIAIEQVEINARLTLWIKPIQDL